MNKNEELLNIFGGRDTLIKKICKLIAHQLNNKHKNHDLTHIDGFKYEDYANITVFNELPSMTVLLNVLTALEISLDSIFPTLTQQNLNLVKEFGFDSDINLTQASSLLMVEAIDILCKKEVDIDCSMAGMNEKLFNKINKIKRLKAEIQKHETEVKNLNAIIEENNVLISKLKQALQAVCVHPEHLIKSTICPASAKVEDRWCDACGKNFN